MLELLNLVRSHCPEVDAALLDRHFRSLPPGYFERHAPADIARHLCLLARLGPDERVAVEVRPLAPHTFEVLLVGEDYTGAVACITAAVAAERFNLEDVQVYSYLQTTEEEEVEGVPYFVIQLRITGNLRGRSVAEFADQLRDRLREAFAHLAQGNFPEAQAAAADTRAVNPGHATPCPAAPPTGRRRPRYENLIVGGDFRLERKLAAGGVGTVYEATQLSLNRKVAVKLFQHSGKADDDMLLRFNQEARVLAQFSCAYIVQILAAGTIPGEDGGVLAWMAMEYLAGGDLARWQRENGSPPPALACRWFRQALEGLHYAHRRGVLHRDLKPHNLLLTSDGHLKVSDFGLLKRAQVAQPELTPQAILLGTPHYMSPEQALGEPVDERSDIFSLGTTFFHLLSGRLPFQKENVTALLVQIAQQDAPRLSEVAPQAPLPLAVLIGRMMARRREERYQDVGVILEDLASYERRGLLEMQVWDAPTTAAPACPDDDATQTYPWPADSTGATE
ncbi:MAG TPA: serine/threonine-protein kinase [Gemmataceae bacterium]|nr:serine/threonine-protein kinase [Gemmataceae bacterium]